MAEVASRRPAKVWAIRDRATFEALRRGRRVRNGHITVSWVPGQNPDPVRVGYAIGRPVGNAVQRNRLRRRLRALVADMASDLTSGAYLIGVRPGATTMSFAELQITVSKALKAASLGEPQFRTPR